jgi:hypothetical protein
MASEKYTQLKQAAAGFSDELKEVLMKLESMREKIKGGMDHPGIEKNVYRHIMPIASNAEAAVMILQENFLAVLETADEDELLNYIDQLS